MDLVISAQKRNIKYVYSESGESEYCGRKPNERHKLSLSN